MPAATSSTPTRWYQVPALGAVFAEAVAVAAPVLSPASRVNANSPVSARFCRKNPLTFDPSMLTTVWKPEVLLRLTHAETVKLAEVSTTGFGIATFPDALPLRASACVPTWPATQLAPE